MSESYFFLLWPWKCLQLAGKNMRVSIDCLNLIHKQVQAIWLDLKKKKTFLVVKHQ